MNASPAGSAVLMNPSASAKRGARQPTLEHLAQQLASQIADAADADQWEIAVRGLAVAGSPRTAALLPRPWLVALNGGREGLYQVGVRLRRGLRDLGVVQLATIRPCGFGPADIARAAAAADRAAAILAEAAA
jgi:hypothetical protein